MATVAAAASAPPAPLPRFRDVCRWGVFLLGMYRCLQRWPGLSSHQRCTHLLLRCSAAHSRRRPRGGNPPHSFAQEIPTLTAASGTHGRPGTRAPLMQRLLPVRMFQWT